MNKLIHLYVSLITLFLLFTLPAEAQQNAKLPDILPPSPTAFALTRYGGINLGLQTGTAQYSVSLYSLSARKLSLSINLSYSSNGVKVDELGSRVGISWILNAGGAITRTVNDQPDETSTKLTPPATFGRTPDVYTFLNTASQSDQTNLDVSPDFFSFNFNGYSGKFILDGSQVVQLTRSNLKIEFNQTGQSGFGGKFRITTPDGVIYYFGGAANSVESSYNTTQGENCGKTYATAVDNAWYLTKVVHPDGDNIVLDYAALQPYSYPVSISQSRTKSVVGVQTCGGNPYGSTPFVDDTNCETLISTNSVYLTRITASNNNYITFSYVSRQDLPYDKLLSSVNVYQNGNASAIKSFGLNYTYATGNSTYRNQYSTENPLLNFRPFLTSLTESASGTTENHTFSFEYNNISSLPPRLSYSQDDFGYFNGAYNIGLIPKPTPDFAEFFPDATADRSPVFYNAVAGMLQKITYPTGGYDAITYKAPDYRVTELPDPVLLSQNISGVGADLSTPVTTTSTPVVITNSQKVNIKSSFSFLGTPDQADFHAQVYIYLFNTTTGQTVYTGFLNADKTFLSDFLFLNDGNTYVLKCVAYGQYSRGDANLFYYTQGKTMVEKTKTTGGVVVDFVKTYEPVKDISSYKKYYYAALTDLTKSSGSLVTIPKYSSDYNTIMACTLPPPPSTGGDPNPVSYPCGWQFQFRVMHSNSLTNLYGYSQHHICFSSVVEGHGLNFENGGVEHTFTVEPNTPGEILFGGDILGSTFSNRGDGKTGLETFTNTFIKKGTVFQPVRQVTTTYKDDSRLSAVYYGYTVRKRYAFLCEYNPPQNFQYDAFDLNRNYIYCRWVYPDTVITKTFDASGVNSLMQTEVTKYDNPIHLLPTQKIVTRSNGKNWLTQYKYPADFASVAPYDLMYNTLHIWLPVIEQLESSVNPANSATTFAQSTKTDYQVWNGNSARIYPVTISTKTGVANYDARIQFQAYDSQGNIQSMSKVNGPQICYVYGYGGNYPVAQVTNADYNTVVAALGGATAVQAFRDNLNPTDAAVKSFLAPLRSIGTLGNALVITYTYKQLIGVTSMTDAKGQTTSYEYDGFQRLTNVKDKDGNIVKHIDYHYQGQ